MIHITQFLLETFPNFIRYKCLKDLKRIGHILCDILIYNTLYDDIARDKLEVRDILGISTLFSYEMKENFFKIMYTLSPLRVVLYFTILA